MKLSVIVENGGIADTTINFTINARPNVDFTINPNPSCPNVPVTSTTSACYSGSPGINNWYWDLATRVVNAPNANNQVEPYAVGVYTIRHDVRVNNFCKSD